jgi:hypothetical protein
MELVELLSLLGTPARASARIILFLPRYILDDFSTLRNWPHNAYALQRFGPSFRWRVWLIFDCRELEELEDLINWGTDEEVWKLRETQLEGFRLVALVVSSNFNFYQFIHGHIQPTTIPLETVPKSPKSTSPSKTTWQKGRISLQQSFHPPQYSSTNTHTH